MKVLIIGATGYLGGSILSTLREHFKSLELYALVRSSSYEHVFRDLGVHTVCTGGDVKKISEWVSAVDVVVNAADSDDIELANTILTAMKARWDTTSRRSILLHISGVAVFLDERTDGVYDEAGKIWNDGSEQDIKGIRPSALHAPVDLRILEAGTEDFVNTYIVCPGAVIGPSLSPAQSASFFVKAITEMTLAYKRAIFIGEGTNEFSVVGIEDTMDLVQRVLNLAMEEVFENRNPYTRYFIGDGAPISWKSISEHFGKILYECGELQEPHAESKMIKDVAVPFSIFLGSNLRVERTRSRDLGWMPRSMELGVALRKDIDAALQLRRRTQITKDNLETKDHSQVLVGQK